MSDQSPAATYQRDGHIATITYNRPKALNAVNGAMRQALDIAWTEFREDEQAWVAIVTGAGRAFCAGADLRDGAGATGSWPGSFWEWPTITTFESGMEIWKPTIAAVNGPCIGYGLTAVLACDFVLASERASFAYPEVKLGQATIVGALRLPDHVAIPDALELLLTGDPIDADRAKEIGLAWQVHPHDQLLDAAHGLAERLCQGAPLAVRATSEMVRRGRKMGWTDAVRMGETMRRVVGQSEDSAEGGRAWAEKTRPPMEGPIRAADRSVGHDEPMEIHGNCDPAFSAVRDAFEQNFADGLELGAAAAVTLDGELVVDIWAGAADSAGNPWQRDMIVNVYSTTKTMAAVCMLMLADRGELDFDAPVARYWPEFAQHGKESVLVSHVMSHTAGLPGFVPPVVPPMLYDVDRVAAQLAGQQLWWEPGTKSGYHAITQGNLEGEILYRITGERMAQWFAREVAAPLGADFWMSLPASEDHRVAELQLPPPPTGMEVNGVPVSLDSIAMRTLMSCPLNATEPRTREWRAAEIPAAGGLGSARSIAAVHSMLANGGEVNGVRLLSEAGARRALEPQIDGVDEVLMLRLRHGLGFALEMEGWVNSPNPNHMFWGGWGGSLATVDFDARMTVSYVMNRMDAELTGDPRGGRLVNASYASLS